MWRNLKHPLARFGCRIDPTDPERIAVLAWMQQQRDARLARRWRRAAERTAREARMELTQIGLESPVRQVPQLVAPSWLGLFSWVEFTPEEEAWLDELWASPEMHAAAQYVVRTARAQLVAALDLRMVLDE
jgi:hypothetical protein